MQSYGFFWNRIELKILLITFKILHDLTPHYLTDLVSVKSWSRYRLHSSGDVVFLNYPTGQGKAALVDRAFDYIAPHLWNRLPSHIIFTARIVTFKSILNRLGISI